MLSKVNLKCILVLLILTIFTLDAAVAEETVDVSQTLYNPYTCQDEIVVDKRQEFKNSPEELEQLNASPEAQARIKLSMEKENVQQGIFPIPGGVGVGYYFKSSVLGYPQTNNTFYTYMFLYPSGNIFYDGTPNNVTWLIYTTSTN